MFYNIPRRKNVQSPDTKFFTSVRQKLQFLTKNHDTLRSMYENFCYQDVSDRQKPPHEILRHKIMITFLWFIQIFVHERANAD